MKYTIQWKPKGTTVTFKGAVDMDDVMDANYVLNRDARYYTHSYSIWNFTDCDLSKIQKNQLKRAVANDIGAGRTLYPFKLALVVNDDYSQAISQAYIEECVELKSIWQFKIFHSIDDATKWCST